jgi:hypothetical protein
MHLLRLFFLSGILLGTGLCSRSSALIIELTDVTPGGMSATAFSGFEDAAARFESVYSDPVTVRLDVGFESVSSGALGETTSVTLGSFYDSITAALVGDVTTGNDAIATSNLPGGTASAVYAGTALEFLATDPSGIPLRAIDADGGANNSVLDVTRANMKALGLVADNGTRDATITMNSDFSFDFDPLNGISAGMFDFVGIATHEIGHALGFFSGVDVVDVTAGSGPSAPVDLSFLRVFSVLDLYRYSDASVAAGAGVLDLAVAGTPYFSIDGGATNLAPFSTGSFNGDGRQASHWKDSLGLGTLDPTFAPAELATLTSLDLLAFDAIGWDLTTPEPSTAVMLSLGVLGLAAYRRRRTGRVGDDETQGL